MNVRIGNATWWNCRDVHRQFGGAGQVPYQTSFFNQQQQALRKQQGQIGQYPSFGYSNQVPQASFQFPQNQFSGNINPAFNQQRQFGIPGGINNLGQTGFNNGFSTPTYYQNGVNGVNGFNNFGQQSRPR